MKVNYVAHPSYLEVITRGELGFKDHIEKAKKISELLVEKGVSSLFLDIRDSITTLNPIEAASLLNSDYTLSPVMKSIAFYMSLGQLDVPELQVYVMNLINNGYAVRTFTDRDEGIEWILNQAELNTAMDSKKLM